MTPGRTDAVRLANVGDIAEVLPGLSTGSRFEHDPAGSHQVVQSRHLTPGLSYVYRPEDEFRIDPGRDRDTRRYELRTGDVLLMSRGTRNVASWIAEVPHPAIAPVSFYILRPRDGVEPGYLTWYLNQPGAQRDLAQIRTGAGTPLVQRSAFTEMRIPIPDLATQRQVAALGELMVREQMLLTRRAEAAEREHATTSERLAHKLLESARSDPNADGGHARDLATIFALMRAANDPRTPGDPDPALRRPRARSDETDGEPDDDA